MWNHLTKVVFQMWDNMVTALLEVTEYKSKVTSKNWFKGSYYWDASKHQPIHEPLKWTTQLKSIRGPVRDSNSGTRWYHQRNSGTVHGVSYGQT